MSQRILLGTITCMAVLVGVLPYLAAESPGKREPAGLDRRVPWTMSKVRGSPEPPSHAVIVYKVDRLSRSLLDFARMMELFERHQVAFVSVTQQFNTATSMGRLILNVLLSFAQFEREIISERTRDKIAAARRKGKWSGGMPRLGYDVDPRLKKLIVNEEREQTLSLLHLLQCPAARLAHLPVSFASRRRDRTFRVGAASDHRPGPRRSNQNAHGAAA